MGRWRVPGAPDGGKGEYVFYAQGGWSWSIPYIAGMYALAAQVEPKITPERFWALAMKTGRTVPLRHKDKDLKLGPILDPARLIEAIQRGDLSDEAAVAAELEKYKNRMTPVVSQASVPKEVSEKLARLDIDSATRTDVIDQLGKPASYIRGNEVLFYKDIDGVSGHCLYRAQAQGVALWFADNRLSQMVCCQNRLR